TQVAGRAGRGDDPGQVILQTYSPEHPVVQAVQRHDYHSFITSELEQREALSYPPCGRLILLRLTGVDETEVGESADRIATALQPPEEGSYDVLGPVPAPVMRVADRFRWQILLKFPLSESVELPELPEWENLRSLCSGRVSLAIDVDPLNFK
ncbi:primosomal protein N', partial [Oscillatoriales cyanobacterium LEGE 11467]|nr:primosomal protein N' [Zarconia navalis LEGE 11467]